MAFERVANDRTNSFEVQVALVVDAFDPNGEDSFHW
jgi:hypothetical protein